MIGGNRMKTVCYLRFAVILIALGTVSSQSYERQYVCSDQFVMEINAKSESCTALTECGDHMPRGTTYSFSVVPAYLFPGQNASQTPITNIETYLQPYSAAGEGERVGVVGNSSAIVFQNFVSYTSSPECVPSPDNCSLPLEPPFSRWKICVKNHHDHAKVTVGIYYSLNLPDGPVASKCEFFKASCQSPCAVRSSGEKLVCGDDTDTQRCAGHFPASGPSVCTNGRPPFDCKICDQNVIQFQTPDNCGCMHRKAACAAHLPRCNRGHTPLNQCYCVQGTPVVNCGCLGENVLNPITTRSYTGRFIAQAGCNRTACCCPAGAITLYQDQWGDVSFSSSVEGNCEGQTYVQTSGQVSGSSAQGQPDTSPDYAILQFASQVYALKRPIGNTMELIGLGGSGQCNSFAITPTGLTSPETSSSLSMAVAVGSQGSSSGGSSRDNTHFALTVTGVALLCAVVVGVVFYHRKFLLQKWNGNKAETFPSHVATPEAITVS